jgi:UDP-N-acetylglucosamine:LPS N-acetylglucosamine transferase
LISKRGAGVLLKKASDIVPLIQNLVADSNKYEAMREATIGLSIPNSTRTIVEEIAALLPAHTEKQAVKAA